MFLIFYSVKNVSQIGSDVKRIMAFVPVLMVALLGFWHFSAIPAAAKSAVALAVYGQTDFTTGTLDTAGPSTLKNAGAIKANQDGGLYVSDYGNSRVLYFPPEHAGSGFQANRVYGQPDFTSTGASRGTTGLNYPHGVAVTNNGDVYIADMFNNRILHYTGTSTVANQVYGQPDFTTTTANNEGVSSNGLDLPQGLAVDGTGLYVADSANNRVLHYPVDSTVADFVYGQGWPGNSTINFTTNQSGGGTMGLNNPRDVAVDNTGIYVADSGNNRVVHYSRGNPVADFVYGQNNLNATQPNQGRLEPTATTLNNPTGITLDHYSGLYVADRNNNRIVYYSPFNGASKNGAAAVRVYGQSSFTAQDTSTTASTFNGPGAVAVDNIGDVFVLDIFNQRVLNFVAGWSIATQPSGNISTNTPFGLSAVLEDIGSGIIFADYTGPATVWIKPGTGPAGAVLGGKTTINTTKGTANFSGLRLDLKGTGYTLSVGCADYALTDTTSFAVN